MNRRLLIVTILIVFIVVSGLLYYYLQSPETVPPTGEVQEFSISAKSWEFNQTRIEVNAGNTIILTIIGLDDGIGDGHGFEIKEFNINRIIRKGETEIIEFVANKRGTFTFRCSVFCGYGHATMKGTLVVS